MSFHLKLYNVIDYSLLRISSHNLEAQQETFGSKLTKILRNFCYYGQ